MSDRFTEKAENALNRSVKSAELLGHTYIGTEHILLALAEDELCCAALILKKNGIDKERIGSCIREYSGTGDKSKLSSKDLTPRAKKILESSYNNAIRYGDGTIGTEHILLSLIDERDSVAIKLLKNMKADQNAIREDVFTLIKSRDKIVQKSKKEAYAPILKQYGKNLCELAKEGRFDPVIGRDTETDRIIRILSRKNKNNPCLIGEAGVGKTAIVEGLAQRIVANQVPPALAGKTIISVDLTSMVAGAKYRGDFEDRIKSIINEVVKHKDIILFIDEIHTIVGAGAAEGAIDASNILKPQLARGDIQVIGATTFEEYRKYIERDAALERRFQPVKINEPSVSETIGMLNALKERYEEHHGVVIDEEAIRECVLLSSKYINDRFLPDKAIDILDEACAMTANIHIENDNTDNIFGQYQLLCDKQSENVLDIKEICEAEYPVRGTYRDKSQKPTVTPSTIKDVVSEACGIPADMIRKSIDYAELEYNLNKAIIGQEKAVAKLVSAIKRADLGFGKDDRPRGLFLFVGESGVGKTALAVELEKNLYFNTASLLRFDMSEYSERQSISKLIGSPPGYVGHDEGGALTEAVRRRPHSVILFDEIEKADKDVLNILLQISDYGYLSDSRGRRVNFKNTIIIATSNLGASESKESVGFEAAAKAKGNENQLTLLKRYYKEELINRFDEIIYFNPLTDTVLEKIVISRLDSLKNQLKRQGYVFAYGNDVVRSIVSKSKSKGLGARPSLREIGLEIEDRIIDLLLRSNESERNIYATVEDGHIEILTKNALKT